MKLEEPMLQTGEAARLLGIHPITLSRWIKDGKVKHQKSTVGKRPNYKIPWSEVQRLHAQIQGGK